jgi:hypothetical protein
MMRLREQDTADREERGPLRSALGRSLVTWLVLLLLGAAELGLSFLHMSRSLRPLIMIPGVLMVIIVVVSFMEVRKGPVIVRAFAVAAAFWLLVLLALGSADPLTRSDYYVPGVTATAEH